MEWHVLSNIDGLILAVYGSALLDEAQEKARAIERTTGCAVVLHHILNAKRPRVGQSISMKMALARHEL